MARPPKPAEGARSRCVCGEMVPEGTAHTCSKVKTDSFENPHANDPGTDWTRQPPAKSQ